MIFKSFLSYLLGLISGIICTISLVNGDVLTLWITVGFTFLISQLVSIMIKNHMKNKFHSKFKEK